MTISHCNCRVERLLAPSYRSWHIAQPSSRLGIAVGEEISIRAALTGECGCARYRQLASGRRLVRVGTQGPFLRVPHILSGGVAQSSAQLLEDAGPNGRGYGDRNLPSNVRDDYWSGLLRDRAAGTRYVGAVS